MYKNREIDIKLKLAALWASLMSLYIYGDYFELYVPVKVIELYDAASILDNPFKLFLASLLMAIPSLMIALSLFLKAPINRRLNITFALVLTLIVIISGATSLSAWNSSYVFYAFLEAIITIVILRLAWYWPKDI